MVLSLLLSLSQCGGRRNDSKEGVLHFQLWSGDLLCAHANDTEKSLSPHN